MGAVGYRGRGEGEEFYGLMPLLPRQQRGRLDAAL